MTKCWFILTDIRQTILLLAFWECIDLSLILKLYFFQRYRSSQILLTFLLKLFVLSEYTIFHSLQKKRFSFRNLAIYCSLQSSSFLLNCVSQHCLSNITSTTDFFRIFAWKKNKQANSLYNYTHYAMENYF